MSQKQSRKISEEYRRRLRAQDYNRRFHLFRYETEKQCQVSIRQGMEVETSFEMVEERQNQQFLENRVKKISLLTNRVHEIIKQYRSESQISVSIKMQLYKTMTQIRNALEKEERTEWGILEDDWRELTSIEWWEETEHRLILVEVAAEQFTKHSIVPPYAVVRLSLQRMATNNDCRVVVMAFLRCYRLQEKAVLCNIHHRQLIYDYMRGIIHIPLGTFALELYSLVLHKVFLWKYKIQQKVWIRLIILVFSDSLFDRFLYLLSLEHCSSFLRQSVFSFIECIVSFFISQTHFQTQPWITLVCKLFLIIKKNPYNPHLYQMNHSNIQSLKHIIKLIQKYKVYYWTAF